MQKLNKNEFTENLADYFLVLDSWDKFWFRKLIGYLIMGSKIQKIKNNYLYFKIFKTNINQDQNRIKAKND